MTQASIDPQNTSVNTDKPETRQQQQQQQRGHLIVVEGLDRSGKTTQCQRLCERISNLGTQVKYVKFPDRTTPTGALIDAYLRGTSEQNDNAIHLLFAANRWEAIGGILEAVSAGITVVVDRYSFSGAVYSAAKDNPALSLTWAWSPEIGLPQPDLVLFLDISEEDAARRGGYGAERYEREEMQRRVRALFGEVFGRLRDGEARQGKDGLNVATVDAGGTLEEVAEQIWRGYVRLEKEEEQGEGEGRELRTLPAL